MTADIIAIEELQSMLDERNVTHEIMYGAVLTDEPRCAWSVESDGRVRVTRWFDNPKQAIAATLGAGTCHADETDTWECVCDQVGRYGKCVTIHVMECSECGRTYEHVNGDYEYCPHCRLRKAVDE